MDSNKSVAILIGDVVGSMRLYQAVGDEKAAHDIGLCVAWMRRAVEEDRGEVISSSGDDVLCVFEDPRDALEAARKIVNHSPEGEVTIHAGLHWGNVVRMRNDVFGDAVNLAARLSATAISGEVLASRAIVDVLPDDVRSVLRPMGAILLRGVTEPVEVFLLTGSRVGTMTMAKLPTSDLRSGRARGGTHLRLQVSDTTYSLAEGQELLIGRAPECQIVLDEVWISRRHARFAVRARLVEFSDLSSTGSFVRMEGQSEFYLLRRSVTLTGSGAISLGVASGDANSHVVRFDITAS